MNDFDYVLFVVFVSYACGMASGYITRKISADKDKVRNEKRNG